MLGLVASALLGSLAVTSAAAVPQVAADSASVTLLVGGNGKAARAFADRSVRLRAIKPATKRSARLTFPVATIAVGKIAKLELRGRLRLKAGRRLVVLRGLQVKLGLAKATVSARVGKRRVPVFAARPAKGDLKLNGVLEAVGLESAKLRLTPRGARLLRARLHLRGLPAGTIGALGVDAIAKGRSGGQGGGGTGGGGGGSATCNPAPNAAPADPSTEPAPLARPDGAVDIASATIVWEPRESWIRYINGGEGTCVFDGAIARPKEVRPAVTTTPLTYAFEFPFDAGWYDPGTGQTAVTFRGGVGFKWKSHGINVSAADPEIEVNGSASRAIFRFNGADDTPQPNKRGVLVDLTPVPDGGTAPQHVFPDMPGTLPAGAESSIFGGFYPPGAPFGEVSITFPTAP